MDYTGFLSLYEDDDLFSQWEESDSSIDVPIDDTFGLEVQPILKTILFIQYLKLYHNEIRKEKDENSIYKYLCELCYLYIQIGLDQYPSKLDFHRTFHQCFDQDKFAPNENIHQTYKKHYWQSLNQKEQKWHHPLQRNQKYCDPLCQLWLIHFNYIRRNQFLQNYGLKESQQLKFIDLHCMKKKEAYAILMHIFKESLYEESRKQIFVVTGLGKKIVTQDNIEYRQLKLFKYLTTEVLHYDRVLPLYTTFEADSSRGTILINL